MPRRSARWACRIAVDSVGATVVTIPVSVGTAKSVTDRMETTTTVGPATQPMFRSGAFVADQLAGVTEDQIQPNGVDLTLGGILEQREPGTISRSGKTIGERETLQPDGSDDDRETYTLDPGGYILQYAETVSIPEEHVGFILPRSSLMRNSAMLNTAVWDAGYTGRGEGLLQVHHEIELERGARVAQLVLAAADHEGLYDGSYQGERVD